MHDSEHVFDAVCKTSGISKEKMLSRSRLWPVVEARMLFVLCASRHGHGDDRIAWALRRDRTTIVKARHNAEDYLSISNIFAEKYDKVQKRYEAREVHDS